MKLINVFVTYMETAALSVRPFNTQYCNHQVFFSEIAPLMRMSPVCAMTAILNMFCNQNDFANIHQTLSTRQDTTSQPLNKHTHTYI